MPILEPPPLRHENPFRDPHAGPRRRASRDGSLPAWGHRLLAGAHEALHRGAAAAAAGRLRALRADLHDARAAQQRRVHARPGGQPLHHRVARHNFLWRESHFRDLIALLGDGLLTTDDPYHKRSRQIMLPAFHRERIAASIDVDDLGDRTSTRAVAPTASRSTCMRGRAGWRHAWRCAPCLGSSPTAMPPARSTRRRCSSRRLRFYRLRPPSSASSARRHTRGRGCRTLRRKLNKMLYAEITATPGERRSAARTCSACCSTRRSEDGEHAHRRADPRRDDDVAVRRPRHDHLDRRRSCSTSWPRHPRSGRALRAEQAALLTVGTSPMPPS